jgi:arylsulfatase A-like enzyme
MTAPPDTLPKKQIPSSSDCKIRSFPKRSLVMQRHLLLVSILASTIASAALPNLVIVHTDEHNFRTLGCYREVLPVGQKFVWGKQAVVDTPHVDSLAKRGVLCTSFYATSPVCTPSRAAMMTGLSPHSAGAPTNNLPLKDEVLTFAEALNRKGYATGYVGKWHLNGGGKPQWGPSRKFGWKDNRYMFNRGHWKKFEETAAGPAVAAKSKKGSPGYGLAGADEKSFSTDWLTDRSIEFVKAHKDKPFCLFLSLPDPHGPNSVRPPYDTMFDGVKFENPKTMHPPKGQVPNWGKGSVRKLNQNSMQDYLGMVKCIDDNLGKLLAVLKAEGLTDNTIVVFTSDHGDLMGEHARHNKGVPFETSAGVAFVAAGPGIANQKVVHEALDMTDFGPSMLALLNVENGLPDAHGRDASALLKTGTAPDGWNDLAFMRSTSKLGVASTWIAAVSNRWKLILAPGDVPWLFDLEKDPDELTNAAASQKTLVKKMTASLKAWLEKTEDPALTNADYQKIFSAIEKS